MKRQKLTLARVRLSRIPFKLIILLLILALASVAGTASLVKFLSRSEYFEIRDIMANEPIRGELSYLKGRNIFSVNLKRESDNLSDDYPNYRAIWLIRVLPDRIFIEFIRRKPVALVRMYKYMFVDDQGVLFDIPKGEGITDLPSILGLETRIFGPKSGKKYSSRELIACLQIINEAGRFRWFRVYKIEKLDVSNIDNISIFLRLPAKNHILEPFGQLPVEQLLEVKVDATDIRAKLRILVQLLREVRNDSGKIKYVDLRFKEPVIKFKDVR